jgi:hypothetical protein
VLAALGYDEQQIGALLESGAAAGMTSGARGSFLS